MQLYHKASRGYNEKFKMCSYQDLVLESTLAFPNLKSDFDEVDHIKLIKN